MKTHISRPGITDILLMCSFPFDAYINDAWAMGFGH